MEKITQIRVEINEIEMKERMNINKTKRWFLENINKIDKPLVGLITGKNEREKGHRLPILGMKERT